jgi:hypothetical protein
MSAPTADTTEARRLRSNDAKEAEIALAMAMPAGAE